MANEVVYLFFKQKAKPQEETLINLLKFFQMPVPRINGVNLDL